MLTSANMIRLIFATPLVLKSYIHIVIILANLSAEYNDFDPNKPLSFKKVMFSPYWKDFEKTIYAKFQSFIKNDT